MLQPVIEYNYTPSGNTNIAVEALCRVTCNDGINDTVDGREVTETFHGEGKTGARKSSFFVKEATVTAPPPRPLEPPTPGLTSWHFAEDMSPKSEFCRTVLGSEVDERNENVEAMGWLVPSLE